MHQCLPVNPIDEVYQRVLATHIVQVSQSVEDIHRPLTCQPERVTHTSSTYQYVKVTHLLLVNLAPRVIQKTEVSRQTKGIRTSGMHQLR
jgi:hypothetical protein